ncbi:hypothetical protein FOA52_002926 [Chlamydomonas sp. UWO 241]|nr:hypothetical protein FOA52_002926 [Chlamydomonas sp. UWO 241]
MPPRAQRGGKAKKGGKAKGSAPQLSAMQLYEQAQIALQYDDTEAAADALKRACKLEPENIMLLEAYGSLLAEMGDCEQATVVLQRCVALSPDAGHEKYMYLGQLMDGAEALTMARKGVELLQVALDTAKAAATGAGAGGSGGGGDDAGMEEEEGALSADELAAQMCSALCSLAEMLMCGAESADSVASEVEALMARAAATCEESPEPGQALCSLRYEQGRAEEALALLTASMAKWFRPDNDEAGDEDDDEMGDGDGAEGAGPGGSGGGGGDEDSGRIQPSYEFRFECAKLLLELSDTTEVAIQVLEEMVEEDDSNPHTWHLLGMAYYGGGMLEEATEIYENGLKLLKKLGVPEDDEVYEDYEDLKGAIEVAGQDAGAIA